MKSIILCLFTLSSGILSCYTNAQCDDMPTNGYGKYYLGLEKGLEKVRIFASVEVWQV